jgi:hypothetical protein
MVFVTLRMHKAQNVRLGDPITEPGRSKKFYLTYPVTSTVLFSIIMASEGDLADSTGTTGGSIVLAIVIPSIFAIVIVILITS